MVAKTAASHREAAPVSGGAAGQMNHVAERVRRLRRRLNEAELDGILITRAVDIRYLTDFSGEDSWALVTARKVYILSDFRFSEEIDHAAPQAVKVLRQGKMSDCLIETLDGLKVKTLGFQAEVMTVDAHDTLRGKLKDIPITLKPTRGWLTELRSIKDETELRAIRRALSVHEQAFKQTLDQLRPGLSESEAVALMEYNMRWIGADGMSFPTIVAVGANASLPHAVPGRTRIKPGKPILIDCGVKAKGYCSDLTRVVCLGPMPRKMENIYRIVLEAQQAAIDAVAPGKTMKEIDRVARDIITAAGYGEQFGHSLGHGIGLEIHEQPTLSQRAEGELQPQQVVTVEPGIYLPGVGGVRIEDDVLVTDKGHRTLSTLPKDLESAII